jgi:hypothetical protein
MVRPALEDANALSASSLTGAAAPGPRLGRACGAVILRRFVPHGGGRPFRLRGRERLRKGVTTVGAGVQ